MLDSVLERFVNETGLVDYASLQARPDELHDFLHSLAVISPESSPDLFTSRHHELAYWINAYNACVLKGVLDHYPIESVRGTHVAYGFFWRKRFILGGQKMTLYTLEHEIIRKRYQDARIHFAINCASFGCPRLRRHAFRGDTLDRELNEAAREFVNNDAYVSYDGETLRVSRIFKWFKKDFLAAVRADNTDGGLKEYLALYLSPDRESFAKASFLRFRSYDWSLNDEK